MCRSLVQLNPVAKLVIRTSRPVKEIFDSCLTASIPTLVLITLSVVVISPRFLPAALSCLLDYEDSIMTVRFSLSTYKSSAIRCRHLRTLRQLRLYGTGSLPTSDALTKLTTILSLHSNRQTLEHDTNPRPSCSSVKSWWLLSLHGRIRSSWDAKPSSRTRIVVAFIP